MSKSDLILEELLDRKLDQRRTQQLPMRRMDELDWLEFKRRQAKRQLDDCRQTILRDYRRLTAPQPVMSGRWGLFATAVNHGTTILQGIKLGYRLFGWVRSLRK